LIFNFEPRLPSGGQALSFGNIYSNQVIKVHCWLIFNFEPRLPSGGQALAGFEPGTPEPE
jgi:hypothetical protein